MDVNYETGALSLNQQVYLSIDGALKLQASMDEQTISSTYTITLVFLTFQLLLMKFFHLKWLWVLNI